MPLILRSGRVLREGTHDAWFCASLAVHLYLLRVAHAQVAGEHARYDCVARTRRAEPPAALGGGRGELRDRPARLRRERGVAPRGLAPTRPRCSGDTWNATSNSRRKTTFARYSILNNNNKTDLA